MMHPDYPSKLMLFGEYAVIAGGEGLAVPWEDFTARWVTDAHIHSPYYTHVVQFAEWLHAQGFNSVINTTQLLDDLRTGLDIESNIPIGYGLGSSGAVVAAVYDRYALNKIPLTDLPALKQMLASMENYFHATSSGLDPLVCYVQRPIHILPGEIRLVDEEISFGHIHMHLLDCGNARATHPLVQMFRDKMRDDHFVAAMQEYIMLTNQCIAALLRHDHQALLLHLKKLSAWQWQYFDFAIPEHVRTEWRNALEHGEALYKLCGAGGGGFMLVFSTPH